MGILLGFAPYIVFAVLTGLSVDLALWAALAFAFVVTIRDFAQTRLLRALEVGGTLLFGLLALYTGFIQPGLSVQAVRLLVDGGFLIIAFGSVAMGNPFTLEYARELMPRELWQSALLARTAYAVAGIWSLAFAAATAADAAATFSRRFPLTLDGAVGLTALTLAVAFTARYPAQARLQTAKPQKSRATPPR